MKSFWKSCETLWVHLLCNVYCHKCLRIYYNKQLSSSQMLRIIINDSFGFVIAIKFFHYQNLWWENSFPKISQYTGFYIELYSLFVFQKLLACNVWYKVVFCLKFIVKGRTYGWSAFVLFCIALFGIVLQIMEHHRSFNPLIVYCSGNNGPEKIGFHSFVIFTPPNFPH